MSQYVSPLLTTNLLGNKTECELHPSFRAAAQKLADTTGVARTDMSVVSKLAPGTTPVKKSSSSRAREDMNVTAVGDTEARDTGPVGTCFSLVSVVAHLGVQSDCTTTNVKGMKTDTCVAQEIPDEITAHISKAPPA